MTDLEGMFIYKYVVSPTRNYLDFCYFPDKFVTHLEKELIYVKIFLIQIFFEINYWSLKSIECF